MSQQTCKKCGHSMVGSKKPGLCKIWACCCPCFQYNDDVQQTTPAPHVEEDKNLVNECQSIPLADQSSSLLPTQESGLLPCPFDGRLPEVTRTALEPHMYSVVCNGCCSVAYGGTRSKVIERWNTRASDASKEATDEAVEQEQGRWQDAIREKVITASQIPNADSWVDGAGCDSGDPLDVSLAEIGQVINHLVDEIADLRADASKEYVRGLEAAWDEAIAVVRTFETERVEYFSHKMRVAEDKGDSVTEDYCCERACDTHDECGLLITALTAARDRALISQHQEGSK